MPSLLAWSLSPVALLLAAACASSSAHSADAPQSAPPAPLPATLPAPPLVAPYRVLILGDSISIGYTPFVRQELEGVAEVSRPMRNRAADAKPRPENCEGTNKGVGSVERWLTMEGAPFDVIHFNFGLHDMKRVDAETGRNSNDPLETHQADPDRYQRQLLEITRKLKASGARLVFATTTPVPPGELRPYREPSDAVEYNRRALEVMAAEGVPVNDLFALISEADPALQKPADVHFTREGSRALGAAVAAAVVEVAGAAHP